MPLAMTGCAQAGPAAVGLLEPAPLHVLLRVRLDQEHGAGLGAVVEPAVGNAIEPFAALRPLPKTLPVLKSRQTRVPPTEAGTTSCWSPRRASPEGGGRRARDVVRRDLRGARGRPHRPGAAEGRRGPRGRPPCRHLRHGGGGAAAWKFFDVLLGCSLHKHVAHAPLVHRFHVRSEADADAAIPCSRNHGATTHAPASSNSRSTVPVRSGPLVNLAGRDAAARCGRA